MKKLAFLLVPLAVLLATTTEATPLRCHSEQFTKAKRQLEALVLNKAQREAIRTYEADFAKQWSRTHAEHGCSHHEAHAAEFIAAASGVLSDEQFKSFRGRVRTDAEKLQNDVWSTGVYLENLKKLVKSA